MTQGEEILQKKIEGGDEIERSTDADAYRTVFKALKKDPEFELPASFANRMVRMVEGTQTANESLRERWWIIICATAFVGMFAYMMTKINFSPAIGVYTFFSGYSGLIVFGAILVILLHLIDKRLLRKAS